MCVIDRTFRLIATAALAAFVLTGVGMNAATSQTQTLTARQFLTNPALLLQEYPNGGQTMINAIEQVLRENTATFKAVLDLVPNANQQQKVAIATAVALGAKGLAAAGNQTLAADWQQQIAAVTDPAFKLAATNTFGDVQLGAVGGAPGGAAGAGLGGPGGAPGGGPLQNIGSNPAGTPPFTITSSTTGTGTSTTTTTLSEPISSSGL